MSLGSHAFQTCTSICTCSLIVVNSLFVLYLMCCFSNNPLYMDFRPIKILFCSVLFSLTPYTCWVELAYHLTTSSYASAH